MNQPTTGGARPLNAHHIRMNPDSIRMPAETWKRAAFAIFASKSNPNPKTQNPKNHGN